MEWASRYNEVKALIAMGGLEPTYRAIRRQAKCGHETAGRFIAAMLGEDVLGETANATYTRGARRPDTV